MATNATDRYILQVEQYQRQDREYPHREPIPFCLGTFINAEPGDADAAYGKKQTLNRLRNENGNTMTCLVEGCELQADLTMLETTVAEAPCKLAAFCLKKAWDVRGSKDPVDNKLWENTTTESIRLTGGYACPNPSCDFSAGWSIDGSPGTAGICASEE